MYNQYKTSKIILYRKKASFNKYPFLFAYPLFHKHPVGLSSFSYERLNNQRYNCIDNY